MKRINKLWALVLVLMKRINKLWAAVSVLGLVLAICTADGSNYENGIRFCGIAAFGIGAYLGGFMDL